MILAYNGKKKKMIWLLAALWLAVLAAVIVLTATETVGKTTRLTPVYSVARQDKAIALTFNAAWGDGTTDAVLQTLKDCGVRATFFFVGDYAQRYPESVKKIYNAGHELGNHSMRHKDPTKQDAAALAEDMEACGELIASLTGVKPLLYRAPSGSYNNQTVETALSLGLTPIQWSADSIDWKDPSPEEIENRILRRVSPGGILLFHLGKENTAQALPQILHKLTAQGYTFCTVGELLLQGETVVDGNGVQRPA